MAIPRFYCDELNSFLLVLGTRTCRWDLAAELIFYKYFFMATTAGNLFVKKATTMQWQAWGIGILRIA